MDDGGFILIAAGFLLLFTMTYNCGKNNGVANIRREAIQAGVAEFRVDSQTGTTKFVFIERTK